MHGAVPVLASCALLVSCGTAPTVDEIPGSRVGTMAEHQLEAQHSGMATGTMDCPDLEFDVDAQVRCERTAVLSRGRQVRVLGTVTVTSVKDGGKLHVELDEEVAEFGVLGEEVANQLRAGATQRFGTDPVDATCPYLLGRKATRVTCTVTYPQGDLKVGAVVTGVRTKSWTTTYEFEWKRVSEKDLRRLAFVAPSPSP